MSVTYVVYATGSGDDGDDIGEDCLQKMGAFVARLLVVTLTVLRHWTAGH